MTQIASERREAIFCQARRQADEIFEEARRQCRERHERAIAAANEEIRRADEQTRMQREAKLERTALTLREAVAEEVLTQIHSAIADVVAGPEFPQVLEALLNDIASELHPGMRVLTTGRNVDLCRRWMVGHGFGDLRVIETAGLEDGIAVEDERRTFRVTNTLSTRFAAREAEARRICVRMLFPEDR